MTRRRQFLLSSLAIPALAAAGRATAAQPVRIGALYPLTGNSATAGQEAKAALAFGTDLVNTPHPELAALPLAAGSGLPGLGGAKVAIDMVDHRGDPAVAQTEALRLITQDRVAALIGAYQSSCAYTATAVAERYGIPFVVSDSVAANITERGYKFTFRVTPIADNFAATYMRFIAEMRKAGQKIDTLAIVNENSDYGTSVGDAIEAAAKAAKLPVIARVPYSASSADVSAQVLTLKSRQPSLAIFISYTSDAILYMKTMHSLGYHPPMIIGDDSGFNDPSFIKAVGPISQGAMSRSVWSRGKQGSLTDRLAVAFKSKTGLEMDDLTGRVLQAFLVLADAINRAGSTTPAKVQAALRATDMKPAQLLVGFDGVKFDKTGQNVLGATYLTQIQGAGYVTVWPEVAAAAKLQWPMSA
ncbi:MAG TPA: ABC transporter substrate-binding protein [Acetobacteraceae bacterium]|nr:ABC transporter substrate-binding protein [Acetobacteraceae bacterium]